MPIGSGGSGTVVASTLAGYEIGFDQIVATVNITGTAEGAATLVLTASAYTFDGGLVLAEFFCGGFRNSSDAASNIIVGLYEGATFINRLGSVADSGSTQVTAPLYGACRFTPTAASHTYNVKAWVTVGTTNTPLVAAGAGGTGNNPPAWLRFTKV